MKWCDRHQIGYHSENGECPLCSSSSVDDIEGTDGGVPA